jgi:phosphoenolpyruvate carboxykinase (ATP)
MLTADAFGVMPPIARLTPAQAMYHFLSGYHRQGRRHRTRRHRTRSRPSRPASARRSCRAIRGIRQRLLRNLIAKHGVDCWLVNTGWTGGAYGTGSRMPIKATRALLAAALDGSLKTVPNSAPTQLRLRSPGGGSRR